MAPLGGSASQVPSDKFSARGLAVPSVGLNSARTDDAESIATIGESHAMAAADQRGQKKVVGCPC